METKLNPPSDLAYIIAVLAAFRNDLEDAFAEQLHELLVDYRIDVRDYRAGRLVPDWNAYREDINTLCREFAYPELFPECSSE